MSTWLTTHFTQGRSPSVPGFRGFAGKPDCIISVDDRPFDYHTAARQAWFPMPEAGCPLASLYGALVTLEQCRRAGEVVYLHCYAGITRSRLVEECYRYVVDPAHGLPRYVPEAIAAGQLPGGQWMRSWLERLAGYLSAPGPLPSGLLTSLYLETGPRRYQLPPEESPEKGPVDLYQQPGG